MGLAIVKKGSQDSRATYRAASTAAVIMEFAIKGLVNVTLNTQVRTAAANNV